MNNNKDILYLPVRRYAMFTDVLRGNYMVVVRGEFDIEHAPKWGNFVRWIGGVKPAETRSLKGKK